LFASGWGAADELRSCRDEDGARAIAWTPIRSIEMCRETKGKEISENRSKTIPFFGIIGLMVVSIG
jgi:hypothetical protein